MTVRKGVLHVEHELLGATFEVVRDRFVPVSYLGESPAEEALSGSALADLSGYAYHLVAGDASPALMDAITSREPLFVGSCGFSPMLTGDGSVASIPLVMRTGDKEYAYLDPSPRGEVVEGWLSFLEHVEQDGYAPYAGVEDVEAEDMLLPLLLAGRSARAVLMDYVSSDQALPAPGEVASIRLDAIPAVVAALPRGGETGMPDGMDAYVCLVPPTSAVVLWRSLLSFESVSPVGARGLIDLLSLLPFGHALAQASKVTVDRPALRDWGLLRAHGAFVGSRSLRG